MKNQSVKIGIGFGLTSGVITTLGLLIGLYSSTQSRLAVIGGVLTIALTDALSDALGIHVTQENQKDIPEKNVWQATIVTFCSKFVVASTFVIPVLFLGLTHAVLISVVWGILLLTGFSYIVARQREVNAFGVILEHLTIGALVILASYYVGFLISLFFG